MYINLVLINQNRFLQYFLNSLDVEEMHNAEPLRQDDKFEYDEHVYAGIYMIRPSSSS